MKIASKKTLLFFCFFSFTLFSHGQDANAISQEQVCAFQKFLLDSIPEGTPWFYKSNSAQQKEEMKRIIKKAVPLKFFEPFYLIKLIHWNPAAGFPGSVIHDYRVLFNPEKNKFELSSLQWIKNYRHRSRLEIDKLNLPEIQSYIEEFVSLIPRLDNYGFNVIKIVAEKPLHIKVIYDNINLRRDKPIDEIMIFNVDGVIIKSKMLESLKGHWSSKGRW